MQRLLLSTAMAGLLAGAAMAQTAPATTPAATTGTFIENRVTDAIYASEFVGKRVYVAENAVTATEVADAATDWQDVGEVNNVLFSRDGQVDGILVDVGGFLGIGERTVAVDMSALRLVTDSDTPGDYFVVFQSTRAALEAAPEYDFPDTVASASVAPAGSTTSSVGTAVNNAATAASSAVAGAAATVTGWMNPTEGYARVERASVTAERLDGASVYDANNVSVGKISKLTVGPQGQMERAVVDVGGFLGIGAKPVALDFSQLDIHKQVDGETLRVYVNMTKEQLEALPAYTDS